MSENRPQVSVIMPSLNVNKYIRESIESVLNQSLENIEILCVDAGSNDGTLEILKEYALKDNRMHVFLSNKKSYGSQVNQGIANATGEYIAIVETDDYIKEDMLENLYNLTQWGYIDIVKGNFYHLNELNGERILKVDSAKRQLESLNKKAFKVEEQVLFLEGHPSIWSAIYKRSFLINNNIKFMEEKGGAWVDNPFFYETSLKADTIIYINQAYYYYRESNENSSTNNLEDLSIPCKRINDMFQVLKDNECENQNIKEMLFKRLFRYIEITIENNNDSTKDMDYKVYDEFYKALKNVDIEYVRQKLTKKEKQIYYKFRSPLILAEFENNIN